MRICQFCRFPVVVKDFGRVVVLCNWKRGSEGAFCAIESGQGCGNFEKGPLPPIIAAVPGLAELPGLEKIRLIPLTRGKFAIVDAKDYEWLSQWMWYVLKAKRVCYAVRKENNKVIRMHRLIMETPADMVVDHIDYNGLNNRRSNLRVCTMTQNTRNQRPQLNKTSEYKGVAYGKCRRSYYAQISFNSKPLYLGAFKNEEEAARAYDKKAKELFGEYAYLNF